MSASNISASFLAPLAALLVLSTSSAVQASEPAIAISYRFDPVRAVSKPVGESLQSQFTWFLAQCISPEISEGFEIYPVESPLASTVIIATKATGDARRQFRDCVERIPETSFEDLVKKNGKSLTVQSSQTRYTITDEVLNSAWKIAGTHNNLSVVDFAEILAVDTADKNSDTTQEFSEAEFSKTLSLPKSSTLPVTDDIIHRRINGNTVAACFVALRFEDMLPRTLQTAITRRYILDQLGDALSAEYGDQLQLVQYDVKNALGLIVVSEIACDRTALADHLRAAKKTLAPSDLRAEDWKPLDAVEERLGLQGTPNARQLSLGLESASATTSYLRALYAVNNKRVHWKPSQDDMETILDALVIGPVRQYHDRFLVDSTCLTELWKQRAYATGAVLKTSCDFDAASYGYVQLPENSAEYEGIFNALARESQTLTLDTNLYIPKSRLIGISSAGTPAELLHALQQLTTDVEGARVVVFDSTTIL